MNNFRKIINNKQIQMEKNINFQKSVNTGNKEQDKSLKSLIGAAVQKMIQSSERCVPENGKFSPQGINVVIPEMHNIATIEIKHDEKEYKTQRRIVLGVHKKNGDAVVSVCLLKGTKSEVLEYLESMKNENLDEIIKYVKKLSKELDDFYSSL